MLPPNTALTPLSSCPPTPPGPCSAGCPPSTSLTPLSRLPPNPALTLLSRLPASQAGLSPTRHHRLIS